MSQKIQDIHIKDLVLWTENPRDPIDTNMTDQEIADRAISSDKRNNWSLEKLFEKMGPRFDQSEIPTVAKVKGKFVVYDGNRRVLIGKIIHGYVTVENCPDFSNFDFPEEIPCNVCDKQTALQHVDRKHADSGSWKPLERDIFKHKHMGEDKSPFLILEEATKIISGNSEMNQRFVKDEIFKPSTMHELGFSANDGELKSAHKKDEDADKVLQQIVGLVNQKEITTRKNRGEILNLLNEDAEIQRILKTERGGFKEGEFKKFPHHPIKEPRKTPITKGKSHQLFGNKLALQSGNINNIYSDLLKLYKEKSKKGYSEDFPMLIRMGLRLLLELAVDEKKEPTKKIKMAIDEYLDLNYLKAKAALSTDEKTTLSTQEVKKENIVKLLHVGAHANTATNNAEQTIALSLIIGKMLSISHGK